MDIIIYVLIMVGIGLYKMKTVSADIQSMLVQEPATAEVIVTDIPIGNNMHLYKEQDAYTLILEELGLK